MKKTKTCSICGFDETEDNIVLSLPCNINICKNCIDTYNKQLDRELHSILNTEDLDNSYKPKSLKPHEIYAKLDDYVIGQDRAKKVLSVAVYNHYKRIDSKFNNSDDIVIDKSNVLMFGPTGCGKTLVARTLAEIIDVPFAVADATTLTEAGYVGEDVENILLKLIQNADYDIKKAEYGIIYVDEIDKIATKGENRSLTRDVSGEGVQQALLKIIEGTVASVPQQGGRKHPQQEMLKIDTTNILFICGGAFVGLNKDTINKDSMALGFGAKKADDNSISKKVTPEDITKFGLIPEFVGRLPILVGLEEIDEDALVKILTEPKNSVIKQYTKLLKYDNVKLEVRKKALREIAKKALKLKTGARGLKSIVEELMLDVFYEIPQVTDVDKVIITADSVLGLSDVEIQLKKKKSA